MLEEKQLKKRAIFFGLEDVLIPGKIDPNVDKKAVEEILLNLKKIQAESKNFFFALVSGYHKKIAEKKILEFGLQKFFNEKNSFFVENEYIKSKADFDREVHRKKLEKDLLFQDEFYKKILIEKEIQKKGFAKEETIFIGHDLMLDAYYLWKFAGIDCALLKEALSQKNKKTGHKIKNLIYIRRTWPEIRALLLGKYPKPDYAFLETAIITYLKEELVSAPEIKRIVIEKKKARQQKKTNK